MARLACALAVLLALGAAAAIVPPLTWPLYLARLVVLESSLALPLVALFVRALARPGARRGETLARRARRLAVVPGLLGLVPALVAAPLYLERGRRFSPVEYVRGPAAAPVAVARGVRLDPARADLVADVYRASGSGARPFVVVVHGGSWQRGMRGEAEHLSRALAAAGIAVVDVSYRFAPADLFPAAVADVKCQLGRVRERALEFGLDPARAGLLGRSAGGQIALVAAYSAGDPRLKAACDVPDLPVRAVASAYAPTDLAWGHAHPPRPDLIDGTLATERYLGGPPAAQPESYRLATPQTWVGARTPPTLLVHGLSDRLVSAEHARRLRDVLQAAGRPVRTLLVPLAEHSFDRRPGGVGEQLVRAELLDFFADSL